MFHGKINHFKKINHFHKLSYFVYVLFFINIVFSGSVFADCSQSKTQGEVVKCLEGKINELDASYNASIDKLERNYVKLKNQLEKTSKWPHAINCGTAWDALFMLHGNPINNKEYAWYVQVYPNEYRYVRFNADLSFHDRAGHSDSNIGCANKSIERLRREGRTFEFIQK